VQLVQLVQAMQSVQPVQEVQPVQPDVQPVQSDVQPVQSDVQPVQLPVQLVQQSSHGVQAVPPMTANAAYDAVIRAAFPIRLRNPRLVTGSGGCGSFLSSSMCRPP
jgi:hypothetical protein